MSGYGELFNSLKAHEGLRLKAYQDSRGIWTIGYGRNLQVLKITPEQAEGWLADDISNATLAAHRFPEFACLDTDARRNFFIEFIFNMGALKVSGFKKMLAAITRKDWNKAADEALDSEWAKQVGDVRSKAMTELLRTGSFQV